MTASGTARDTVTNRLQAAVSSALASDDAEVVEGRRTALDYDPYQGGRWLTRISGSATIAGEKREWALIEKVTAGPGAAPAFIREGGRRELLAYRSGLLERLPAGFAAPRPHGLHEDEDGGVLLYLEEVEDERPQPWAPEDWVRAASHLGRFTARGLERPVPPAQWMLQRWSERHGQPAAIPAASLAMAGQSSHPAVVDRFGSGIAAPARSILAAQARLRAALDRLPQTLCHHDAVRANLFSRTQPDGLQTVAIDWETLGIGPVGAEVASLLFSSSRRGDLSAAEVRELVPSVLDAYASEIAVAGFPDAGKAAERGFWLAVALRWSLLRDVMVALTVPEAGVSRGRVLDEGPEAALDELVDLTRFLLDAWERAQAILDGR